MSKFPPDQVFSRLALCTAILPSHTPQPPSCGPGTGTHPRNTHGHPTLPTGSRVPHGTAARTPPCKGWLRRLGTHHGLPVAEPWAMVPTAGTGGWVPTTGGPRQPVLGDAEPRRCALRPRSVPGQGCPTGAGTQAPTPGARRSVARTGARSGSLTCACPRACRAAGWSRPCRGCTCRRRAGGRRGGRRHPWRR